MKNEFSKREIYPSPSKSFGFSLESIDNIKDNALILLDANVLLLPFTTNVKNVEAIKAVYQRLVQKDQIFLPAQAVREYLDNRAKKLTDINEVLQKKSNQSFNFVGGHPLLESLEEYKSVLELEGELKDSIKKYQNKIRETVNAVQAWGWNDPVSKMYHEILTDRVLSDSELDIDKVSKDLERRNTLKIPPGYKDQKKEQNQAGDLLIWHEILELAAEKEKDVIFVSGDEKADWWHQSGKTPLYPRFELVDEFREKTDGKSFHIVSLSKLLTIYNAEEDVVDAIRQTEFEIRSGATSDDEIPELELSESAITMLVNISNDDNGVLMYLRFLDGTEIRTNGKCLNSSMERREVTKWEAAIEELLCLDMIIPAGKKGEIFKITQLGYKTSDLAKKYNKAIKSDA